MTPIPNLSPAPKAAQQIYRVLLVREIQLTAWVEIQAASEEHAHKQALKEAHE